MPVIFCNASGAGSVCAHHSNAN